MIRKICDCKCNYVFDAKILGKYRVKYYNCSNCGFLQIEDPWWLEEAYSNPINASDTDILCRNIRVSKITAIIIGFLFDSNAKFLDSAGGYGILVRLRRDLGFEFYWYDRYSENLFARCFEYNFDEGEEMELITCFEAFEHFVNPMSEIEFMLEISKNILFTTELYKDTPPKPEEWWYYGLEHGQHVSFYSSKTLNYIADKYSLNYLTFGNIHFFSCKRISSFNIKILLKLKALFLLCCVDVGLEMLQRQFLTCTI